MPSPIHSIFILTMLFAVSFIICLVISFLLMLKCKQEQETPNEEAETIYKIQKTPTRKRKQKQNTVLIKGTILSPEEFKNKNG